MDMRDTRYVCYLQDSSGKLADQMVTSTPQRQVSERVAWHDGVEVFDRLKSKGWDRLVLYRICADQIRVDFHPKD